MQVTPDIGSPEEPSSPTPTAIAPADPSCAPSPAPSPSPAVEMKESDPDPVASISVSTTPESTANTELRAELDTLNQQLRVLESASISARAYIEAWIAFVLGGVAGKLLVDTFLDPAADGFPWHALPFVALSLIAVTDVVRLRLKLRGVREREERGLSRQRELRTLLGLDEIQLPIHVGPRDPEA